MNYKSEYRIANLLKGYGHKIRIMPTNHCKYDLLMDELIKLEIKTAYRSGAWQWKFNIHRHNVVDETQVDYYILRFEGIPGSRKATHALLKAPLGVYTQTYSLKMLLEGAIYDGVSAFHKLDLQKSP